MTARLAEMGEQFRAAAKQVGQVEWRGMLDYPRTWSRARRAPPTFSSSDVSGWSAIRTSR